jgi:hypothetical protein
MYGDGAGPWILMRTLSGPMLAALGPVVVRGCSIGTAVSGQSGVAHGLSRSVWPLVIKFDPRWGAGLEPFGGKGGRTGEYFEGWRRLGLTSHVSLEQTMARAVTA